MTKKRKKRLLYLGNKLSKHGVTPTAIEFLAPKLQQEGYCVISVSDQKNKVFRMLVMLLSVIRYRSEVDYLLIDTYSTTNFWYAYLSAKIARYLKLEYICILHGGDLPKRLINSRRKSEELFKNAKTNIAPSPYLLAAFENEHYKNLAYIANPIDLTNYKFQIPVLKTPKLLWVRSFAEIYNPTLAIEVFEKIKQKFPQAELCMVGPEKDGSLAKCKALAETKSVPVKFTGKLAKEEWVTLAEEYNIFINTTNFDNTPVSVIEAMALGLPVISTNVGGLPYLIDAEKDGVLVPKNNSDTFVNAIDRLIAQPEFAQQLSVAARKKVEQFDWEVVKQKWDAVLQ